MRYENIERAIRDGYELIVKRDTISPRFHALVTLGHIESTHNHLGMTVQDALQSLDGYLHYVRPASPGQEGAE